MKKALKFILIFLFATVSFKSYSQKTEWLFGISKDSCEILSDNIISHLRGNYKFTNKQTFTENNASFLAINFVSDSLKDDHGKGQEYSVIFQNFNDKFYLQKLEGKFSELLPVWQQYIDASANKENIYKGMRVAKNIDNPANSKKYIHCVFQTENVQSDEWYISFKNL